MELEKKRRMEMKAARKFKAENSRGTGGLPGAPVTFLCAENVVGKSALLHGNPE